MHVGIGSLGGGNQIFGYGELKIHTHHALVKLYRFLGVVTAVSHMVYTLNIHSLPFGGDNAALKLIPFNGLEQSHKIAFSETLITLALNKLEKDRAYQRIRKNL